MLKRIACLLTCSVLTLPWIVNASQYLNCWSHQKGWRCAYLEVQQLNADNEPVARWEMNICGDIWLYGNTERQSMSEADSPRLPLHAKLFELRARLYPDNADTNAPSFTFTSHPSRRDTAEHRATRSFRLALGHPLYFFWGADEVLCNEQPYGELTWNALSGFQPMLVFFAKQCFVRECELAYAGRDIANHPEVVMTYQLPDGKWKGACVGTIDQKSEGNRVHATFTLPAGLQYDGEIIPVEGTIKVSWCDHAALDCEVAEELLLLGPAQEEVEPWTIPTRARIRMLMSTYPPWH